MPMTVVATVDPSRSRVHARTRTGQPIEMDGDPPDGDDSAAGPKETLLAALAGCTAMDVASILRKKRQAATAYEISVSGESAGEHPRIFTSIAVEHRVADSSIERRSASGSTAPATRYCPVNAMLSTVATIEHRYRLTTDDGDEHEALVAVTGPDGARVV
jgi:putative redox protein